MPYCSENRRVKLLPFVLSLAAAAALSTSEGEIDFAKTQLAILTANGEQNCFTMEEARSREQRALGLMFRKELPESWGMIFILPSPRYAEMWMKNTSVRLDMLFADSQNIIREIIPDVSPDSTDIIVSAEPVQYIVELQAGVAGRHAIAPGAKIMDPEQARGLQKPPYCPVDRRNEFSKIKPRL